MLLYVHIHIEFLAWVVLEAIMNIDYALTMDFLCRK